MTLHHRRQDRHGAGVHRRPERKRTTIRRPCSERLRDHSWFIAFAPAEAPRIAVAVLVENGGFGSTAAAPIARKVMDTYLLDANGKLKVPLPPGTVPLTPRSSGPCRRSRQRAAVPRKNRRRRPTEPAHTMIYEEVTQGSRTRRTLTGTARMLLALKLDGPLLIGLALVALYGLIVLYSASGQSLATVGRAGARLVMGTVAMLVLAQVNPNFLRRTSPWLFALGIVLLLIVDVIGYIGKGAQRWLDLGFVRFQPSELMKLAVPMMCAWYLHERAAAAAPPPRWACCLRSLSFQWRWSSRSRTSAPALLIAIGGMLVIVMAGLQLRVILESRRCSQASARGSAGASCTTTSASACSRSSIRRTTRSAPATTSSSRRSPSARAACSARAG